MQVNILEAKNRLSEMVKSAQAGVDVIIANRGKPLMRLVPINSDLADSAPINSGASLSAWLQARSERSPLRNPDDIEASIQEARNAWD
jgi:prevent-host-death family protein